MKLGALSNANPLGFDSLGKWVEAFIEHLSAGSIALSGLGGVSSFSACVPKTQNLVLDHPSVCICSLYSWILFV